MLDDKTWELMRWNGGRYPVESLTTLIRLARDGYIRSRDRVYDPRSSTVVRARDVPEIKEWFFGSPLVAPRTWRRVYCILAGVLDVFAIIWIWRVSTLASSQFGVAARLLTALIAVTLIWLARLRLDTWCVSRLICSLSFEIGYKIRGETYEGDQRLLDQVDWIEEERLRRIIARNHTLAGAAVVVLLALQSVA